MMSLLVFKERLKEFYTKFDIYITPVIKFVYSYLAFWLMNRNIGFMAKLTNPLVPLVLALVCSFLPYSAVSFLAAVFMLAHLWAVSFEVTLVMAVFVLVVALLYYGFHPHADLFRTEDSICDSSDCRPVRRYRFRDPGGLRCFYLLYAAVCETECRSSDQ